MTSFTAMVRAGLVWLCLLLLVSPTMAALFCLPICEEETPAAIPCVDAEGSDACCEAPLAETTVRAAPACSDCVTPCCEETEAEDWHPPRNQPRLSPAIRAATPAGLPLLAPQVPRPPAPWTAPRMTSAPSLYVMHCSLLR